MCSSFGVKMILTTLKKSFADILSSKTTETKRASPRHQSTLICLACIVRLKTVHLLKHTRYIPSFMMMVHKMKHIYESKMQYHEWKRSNGRKIERKKFEMMKRRAELSTENTRMDSVKTFFLEFWALPLLWIRMKRLCTPISFGDPYYSNGFNISMHVHIPIPIPIYILFYSIRGDAANVKYILCVLDGKKCYHHIFIHFGHSFLQTLSLFNERRGGGWGERRSLRMSNNEMGGMIIPQRCMCFIDDSHFVPTNHWRTP